MAAKSENRLLIIGANGNIGLRVARAALTADSKLDVTILVRSRAKLAALLDEALLDKAQVIEGDVLDAVALRQAMAGHGYCINTAGNAEQKEQFKTIFQAVVDAAVESLAAPKRLWMLGGAPVLDVPGMEPPLTLNDLPIFSRLPYVVHSPNWAYLVEHGASLDWTMMCPGMLHPATEADKRRAPAQLCVRTLPLWIPGWQRSSWSPRLLLALTIAAQLGSTKVSLEEVAQAMLDNLQPGKLNAQKVSLVKK